MIRKLILAIAVLASLAAFSEADPGKIYSYLDSVDYEPRFPGGDSIMRAWIAERIPASKMRGSDQPFYCSFLLSPFGEIDHGSIRFLTLSEDGTLVDARPYTPYQLAMKEVIKDIPGFVGAEVDYERVFYQYIIPYNCELPRGTSAAIPEMATAAPGVPNPAYTAGTRQTRTRTDGIYSRWDKVDCRPEFPGGSSALYKAINANLNRPHVYSHQKNIFCSFVIRANGDIDTSTIKCVRLVDGHYADIADSDYTTWEKRVMESVAHLQGFRPASVGGKDVPYEYILPLHFR